MVTIMPVSKNPQKIKEMFNTIADSYDFNNNLISLGIHRVVKYISLKSLDIKKDSKVLDECTGTGDFAKFILQICPSAKVTGIDFSDNMLSIAKKRVPDADFILSDCTSLPFEDNSFDIVTMGFGLRNIEDYNKAIQETQRVLKPQGEFLQLDFGQKNFFSKIFDIIVPPLIKLFYGKNLPYNYLLQSKKEFPEPEELIRIFESNGFKLKCRKDFLFGVISAQIMQKI